VSALINFLTINIMPIQSINPATEEIFATFDELTDEELENKLSLGDKVFKEWRNTSFEHRAELMINAAEILKKNSRKYGEIISKEMGKPIGAAVAEVEKCAWVCEYYAENAEKILKEDVVESAASLSYVRFDPLGIVLAVMPWNYPFWQVFRFIAPTIMAGNAGVLKHASNVPQSALAIEEVMIEAGFPAGLFQTLLIGSSKVERVIRDERVKAATLTGSEFAGSQVAKVAGEEIMPTLLELGGSDPYIVLEDADITASCEIATKSRLQNAGQSCIAAKRFIVMESVAEEFLKKFKIRFESQIVGDPMDENTAVGPLASKSIFDEVEKQVNKSVEMGATIVTGGKRVGEKGYFYAPTIISNVKKGIPVYDEEVFGPVATFIVVKSDEEAIEVANSSPLGLGASIHTKDIERAKKMATQIESGSVFINSMVSSDPRLPFGGVKKSGYGRELSSYGIKAFVNIKTVWIK